jgi:hypothetical protein
VDISRYFTSTRHLVGCGFALVGLVLAVTGVAGAFWPLVIVGLYAVGALIAPAERRVSLEIAGPRELRKLLRTLPRDRLPSLAARRLTVIETVVDGLLARPDELAARPEAWFTVDQAVRRDLPATLEAYLNLPRWYTARNRLPGVNRDAATELIDQLRSIENILTRVAEDVYDGHAEWMVEHGRRLAERVEDE